MALKHSTVISSEYLLPPVTKEGGPLTEEKPVAVFILLCPLSLWKHESRVLCSGFVVMKGWKKEDAEGERKS